MVHFVIESFAHIIWRTGEKMYKSSEFSFPEQPRQDKNNALYSRATCYCKQWDTAIQAAFLVQHSCYRTEQVLIRRSFRILYISVVIKLPPIITSNDFRMLVLANLKRCCEIPKNEINLPGTLCAYVCMQFCSKEWRNLSVVFYPSKMAHAHLKINRC